MNPKKLRSLARPPVVGVDDSSALGHPLGVDGRGVEDRPDEADQGEYEFSLPHPVEFWGSDGQRNSLMMPRRT